MPSFRSWKSPQTLGSGCSGNTRGAGPQHLYPWAATWSGSLAATPTSAGHSCPSFSLPARPSGMPGLDSWWLFVTWRWSALQGPELKAPTQVVFFSYGEGVTVDSVGVSTCWPAPPSPGPFRVPSPLATCSHLCVPVPLCLGMPAPADSLLCAVVSGPRGSQEAGTTVSICNSLV